VRKVNLAVLLTRHALKVHRSKITVYTQHNCKIESEPNLYLKHRWPIVHFRWTSSSSRSLWTNEFSSKFIQSERVQIHELELSKFTNSYRWVVFRL